MAFETDAIVVCDLANDIRHALLLALSGGRQVRGQLAQHLDYFNSILGVRHDTAGTAARRGAASSGECRPDISPVGGPSEQLRTALEEPTPELLECLRLARSFSLSRSGDIRLDEANALQTLIEYFEALVILAADSAMRVLQAA